MCSENIHIAGRYNKYLRNLSQSPWIDKDDVRIKDSVQELIEDGFKKYLKYDKLVFSSSGREDVDVRMLGRGRPFVFKVVNPFDATSYNSETMKQIQNFINSTHKNKIQIRDLQVVTKESVAKNLKDGEESKSKQYRALCCCSRRITQEDIDKISAVKDLYIDQKTPIRVLHRRTWAIRRRKIFELKLESVKLGDYESITEANLSNVFALNLVTEAGTYIKEFVHGDFGRTEPNLSSLLGGCETDLMELDVMEVYLDWPPVIDESESCLEVNSSSKSECPIAQSTMNESEISLQDLYSRALKTMQDAESMPRCDERQNLYIQARRNFEQALSYVDKLELFSDNETIEDISTTDLKYLLIPAYLGKIAISSDCSLNRLDTFTRAEQMMETFLKKISKYGLGNRSIDEAIKRDELEETSEKSSEVPSLQMAMQTRNEKIENFKRMKLLEERISELEKRIKSNQNVDEEISRDYYTSLIKKWIEDTYESLVREVKPALYFERTRSSPPLSKPSTSLSQNKNLKTFTIVKDDLQKAVFGLGYPSRPSVTVDEFISNKMKHGELAFQTQKEVYGNSLQRYAEKPDLRREQEELSDAEHDEKEERDDVEELNKKRRWDEFKDENSRGSGNRHNMG